MSKGSGCVEWTSVTIQDHQDEFAAPARVVPVLFDIVKRRFVRTPGSSGCEAREGRKTFLVVHADGDLVCRGETLNLPHMMGLPNRALGQISRSWSFCADGVRPHDPRKLQDFLDKDRAVYATNPMGLRRDEHWQ